MYVEIKDNKLLSWCENPYLDYEYVEIDYAAFDPGKYEVMEGALVDISDTEAYRQRIVQKENVIKKEELQKQLSELDLKRIRAICEPELKNPTTGETWLEYYTQQAKDLRVQINAL